MLRKDFRERFNKINSKNKVDIVVEITVGLLYFLIIALSFMSQIKVENFIFVFGCSFYMIGLILTYRGYYFFYVEKGLITKDVFSFSRNPTYFFGFIALFGMVLLTQSWIILIILVIISILTHKIILNEEKYLLKEYGKKYLVYFNNVRRYI